MTDDAIRALAQRFFDAIEAGDIDAVIACYAPDAAIWHNTDERVQGPAENRAILAGLIKYMPERTYEDRRLETFPGGFVQQHVLVCARRDGRKVRLPACLVCAVKDERITRLDEYFDSAAAAAFTA